MQTKVLFNARNGDYYKYDDNLQALVCIYGLMRQKDGYEYVSIEPFNFDFPRVYRKFIPPEPVFSFTSQDAIDVSLNCRAFLARKIGTEIFGHLVYWYEYHEAGLPELAPAIAWPSTGQRMRSGVKQSALFGRDCGEED